MSVLTHDPALLRAVIDAPADDLPRLIYADWLDENGDPSRAEFIRVQVELAGADDSWTPPRGQSLARDALRRRERGLLERSRAGKLDLGFGGGPWTGIVFRRGFVEQLACSWEDWTFHHRAIRAETPLRKVRLVGGGPVGLNDWAHFHWDGNRYEVLVNDLFPGIEFELPAPRHGTALLRAIGFPEPSA